MKERERRTKSERLPERNGARDADISSRARAVLELQRRAGNRAVSALLQPTVQRHRVIDGAQWGDAPKPGEQWRVSDDAKMAVVNSTMSIKGGPDKQLFWAEPGVIASAKATLGNINSGFDIDDDGQEIDGPPPSSKLHKVKATNKDVPSTNDQMGTFRNCDENTRHLLGMRNENPFRRVNLVVKGLGVTQIPLFPEDSMSWQVDPRVFDLLVEITGLRELPPKEKERVTKEWKKKSKKEKAARPLDVELDGAWRNLVRSAYASLPEFAKAQSAARLGINQTATPEVGQGVGMMNPGGTSHFIPAVASSGGDWVSLENDTDQAKGGAPQDNPNWYYRMYGPVTRGSDQSVYGEAMSDPAKPYGASPMSILLTGAEQLPNDVASCRERLKREIASTARTLCRADHSINWPNILAKHAEYGPIVKKIAPYGKETDLPDDFDELVDIVLDIKRLVDSGPAVVGDVPRKVRAKADVAVKRLVNVARPLKKRAEDLGG